MDQTTTVAHALRQSLIVIEEASDETNDVTRLDAWRTSVEHIVTALARDNHEFDQVKFLIAANYPLALWAP